jgi:hypothetical protein
MKQYSTLILALAFALTGCSSNKSSVLVPAKKPGSPVDAPEKSAVPQKKEIPELTAGNSNELTGTWVSPCFEFINNKFARATYIFHSDTTLEIFNQVYLDDDCRALDTVEHLKGTAAYGNPVAKPAGAKAVDLEINGKVVRSIYSLENEKLCFGSNSSPVIDGRPSEIKCSKIFKRL